MRIYLEGTKNGSAWRDSLKATLLMDVYDPTGNTTDDLTAVKASCDYVVYTISPLEHDGLLCAQLGSASAKDTARTILLFLKSDTNEKAQTRTFADSMNDTYNAITKLVADNGAVVKTSLTDVTNFLNNKFDTEKANAAIAAQTKTA